MRITCVLPDASYSLAKMFYSLKAAPRPVWKFLFVASYICFCLSGERGGLLPCLPQHPLRRTEALLVRRG